MIPEQTRLGRGADEEFYGTLRRYGVARWRASQKNPMTFKVWQKVERLAFMFVLMVLVSVFHPSTTSISRVCGAIKGIPGRFIERLHVLNRCSALYRWRNVWGSISDLVLFLWIWLPLKVDWCLVNMKSKSTPFTFLMHVLGLIVWCISACYSEEEKQFSSFSINNVFLFRPLCVTFTTILLDSG